MALLKEMDVIELGEEHTVYADVPEHFCFDNCRGSWKLTHHEVRLEDDNFDFLRGRYVVVAVTQDGGGQGHGPGDIYPDGHHVWCEMMDKASIKVDFYQTGCFTAMIQQITPIGTASVKKWTMKGKRGSKCR